jgi:hypothetical protein
MSEAPDLLIVFLPWIVGIGVIVVAVIFTVAYVRNNRG